jgi:haloalkane dehalogenase
VEVIMSIPSDPSTQSRWATVLGRRMHYVEAGAGDPPIVLVHGLPTHAGLWRDVLPQLATRARTIAVDLLGFGRSDKPLDVPYNVDTYVRHFEGTLAAAGVHGPLLVAMDLGVIVALSYAMEHEADVRGVAMFEGWFLPMREAWAMTPLLARLNMRLLRSDRIADRFITNSDAAVERFLRMGTVRKLAPSEVASYRDPLADPRLRRRIWVDGVGPRAMGPTSRAAGDVVDRIDRYAEWLASSRLPKTMLYATPGMVVGPAMVARARETIANLGVVHVGAGKHFLPEDRPIAIANAVARCHAKLTGAARASLEANGNREHV